MKTKNFKDRSFFKRHYYVVADGYGYVNEITTDQIRKIRETGKYEFTLTYDYYDHKETLPCKVVVEEITTSKRYFDLKI